MRKLLRADFSRLFRDKVFLASCALMFFAGGGIPVIHFFDNIFIVTFSNYPTYTTHINHLILSYNNYLP